MAAPHHVAAVSFELTHQLNFAYVAHIAKEGVEVVWPKPVAKKHNLELSELLGDVTQREFLHQRVRKNIPPIGWGQLQVIIALADRVSALDEFCFHGLASQSFYACAAKLTLTKTIEV